MFNKKLRNPRQTTQRKLLRAASDAFAADGFDAASTRAIADRAGVNIALIAYHFGGKDGLYHTVLEGWVTALCEGIQRELAHITSPEKRTDTLVSVFLRNALIESPGVAALVARESVMAGATSTTKHTATALKPLVTLFDALLPSCETSVSSGTMLLGLLLRLAAPMPSLDGEGAKGYHSARIRALSLLKPTAIGPQPGHQHAPHAKEKAPKVKGHPEPPTLDFVD